MIDPLSVPRLSEIEQAIKLVEEVWNELPLSMKACLMQQFPRGLDPLYEVQNALRRGDALLTRADREKAIELVEYSQIPFFDGGEACREQARTLLQLQEPS
jgi:hypothetical protein